MRVIICENYEEVSRRAAEIISRQVRDKPRCVIGLATGSTPMGAYRHLVKMHEEESLDFSNVTTFNLDEYLGLPPDHPQSYHYFMWNNLFDGIEIPAKNTNIPDGQADDLTAECEEYERKIRDAGGIDLQLLGLGRDGHVGFNEPGSSLGSRTRIKALAPETINDNSRFFGSEEEVPRLAITMGVGTIMDSMRILILASGEHKAEAVRSTVEGPITAGVPASALQLHPRVTLVLDPEASKLLERKEYYRYVEKRARELFPRS